MPPPRLNPTLLAFREHFHVPHTHTKLTIYSCLSSPALRPARAKGIAFPTCLSVNGTLQNFSPSPSDETAATNVLASNDLVKIALGAHIDGYAVLVAET